MTGRLKCVKPRKLDVAKDLKKERMKANEVSRLFFLEEMHEHKLFSSCSYGDDWCENESSGFSTRDEILSTISIGMKHGYTLSRIFRLSNFLHAFHRCDELGQIGMNTIMRYLEIVSMQQDMVDTSLLSLQECCKHSNESAYDSDGDVIH